MPKAQFDSHRAGVLTIMSAPIQNQLLSWGLHITLWKDEEADVNTFYGYVISLLFTTTPWCRSYYGRHFPGETEARERLVTFPGSHR